MQQQEERFVIVVVAVLDSTHFKSKQEDGNLNRSLVSLKKEKKKKSETELTASVLKNKRSKTHKRLKRTFLIGQNRTARFVLFCPI